LPLAPLFNPAILVCASNVAVKCASGATKRDAPLSKRCATLLVPPMVFFLLRGWQSEAAPETAPARAFLGRKAAVAQANPQRPLAQGLQVIVFTPAFVGLVQVCSGTDGGGMAKALGGEEAFEDVLLLTVDGSGVAHRLWQS